MIGTPISPNNGGAKSRGM